MLDKKKIDILKIIFSNLMINNIFFINNNEKYFVLNK